MGKKVVSVVGATGVQGGSVVDALLADGTYTVRAITRNPESTNGKALAARGAEVVQADANDVSSLTAAFAGSSAIYAVTNFFEPFAKSGPKKASEVETQQGINLAKAAAATSTLEHYIWSTLPDAKTISDGRYLVPHFEAKNVVDRYIRSDASLLAKTTFLWVTFYAQNYIFPMYKPIYVPTAGKYIQVQSTPADVPVASMGDATTNVGLFVKATLANPQKTQNGTFVLAKVEDTTIGESLQRWAKASDNKAQYVQVDRETFHDIWPLWAEEMGVMMEFWDWAREKSWTTTSTSKVVSAEELGVKEGIVSLDEAFKVLKL